ncbi:MAG: hypothetical protein ABFQ89_04490 [Chloroflexota bacterium]
MKKLTVILTVVLLVALTLVLGVDAAKPKDFYLEKVLNPGCGTLVPFAIQEAIEPFTYLNGVCIDYLGPVVETPPGRFFVSSNVLIDVGEGTSISGHFVFNGKTGTGMFTLGQGTGALEGFHAVGEMTQIDDMVFALEGTYHFAPYE